MFEVNAFIFVLFGDQIAYPSIMDITVISLRQCHVFIFANKEI